MELQSWFQLIKIFLCVVLQTGNNIIYCMSKAAVDQLTRCAALGKITNSNILLNFRKKMRNLYNQNI